MSTSSIPVPAEIMKEKAVEAVLRASKEPSLKGDLDQLSKKRIFYENL